MLEDVQAVKTYTWDNVKFTVKEITDDESVIGDQTEDINGKCVAVIIDFGENKNTISQDSLVGRFFPMYSTACGYWSMSTVPTKKCTGTRFRLI